MDSSQNLFISKGWNLIFYHKSHGSINRILPFDLKLAETNSKSLFQLPTIGIFRGELLVSGRVVGGCDSLNPSEKNMQPIVKLDWIPFPPIFFSGEHEKMFEKPPARDIFLKLCHLS